MYDVSRIVIADKYPEDSVIYPLSVQPKLIPHSSFLTHFLNSGRISAEYSDTPGTGQKALHSIIFILIYPLDRKSLLLEHHSALTPTDTKEEPAKRSFIHPKFDYIFSTKSHQSASIPTPLQALFQDVALS